MDKNNTIVLYAKNNKDMEVIDSLVRYYEVPLEGLFSRGIWLLTIMRDSEIADLKLAVIDVDEQSGEIKSVSPITLC